MITKITEANAQSKTQTTNSKPKSMPQYHPAPIPSTGNKLIVFRAVAITNVQFQRWILTN